MEKNVFKIMLSMHAQKRDGAERMGKRAFEKKGAVVYRIKLNFCYNIWAWSFVFMAQGPFYIVDFLDWLCPN